jgi:hypothetical protein
MIMYCVYLVTYSGKLLPKYYIGSTSILKATSGRYFGSISSKKWKSVFSLELNSHPELFQISIISEHNTRKEALCEELNLQIKHNVVKSLDYMNESLARPNGMFGMDVGGTLNPMYGKTRPDVSIRMRGNNNIAKQECVREKLKKPKNIVHPIGREHSQTTKDKMRIRALMRSAEFKNLWAERFNLKYKNYVELLMLGLGENGGSLKRQKINTLLCDLDVKTITFVLKKCKEREKIYCIGKGKGIVWNLKTL